MNIGIIDADVIGKKKHRFPNLACMKISSYYKKQGHDVKLLLSYDDIENYMDYDGITVVDIETAKKFNIIKKLHEKSQFKRDIINLPSVIIWLL